MAAVAHERLEHDWPRPRRQPRLAFVETDVAPPPVAVGEPVSTPPRARRPVFAAVLLMALLLVGGSIVDAVAPVAGPESAELYASLALSSSERREHVAQPGETYWSIAEALGGAADIRARVDALQAANGGRPLRAGDRLILPMPE